MARGPELLMEWATHVQVQSSRIGGRPGIFSNYGQTLVSSDYRRASGKRPSLRKGCVSCYVAGHVGRYDNQEQLQNMMAPVVRLDRCCKVVRVGPNGYGGSLRSWRALGGRGQTGSGSRPTSSTKPS